MTRDPLLGAAPEVTIIQSDGQDAGSIELPPLSIAILELPFSGSE